MPQPALYDWLSWQVWSGGVWVDEDVITRADYDYARGYWLEQSVRYQYDGVPMYLAQQIVFQDQMEEVAKTLIHEAAHEFGWTDDDKELIERLAGLCIY